MDTLAEFEKAVETLTPYQKKVLAAIERGPNQMANAWEICWNDFAKEWNAKRSAHGAMFRSILQAAQKMKDKGILVILPPRDEHDTYTYCSLRSNYAYKDKNAAEHSVNLTGGQAATNNGQVALPTSR